MRILIVEDEVKLVDILTRSLRSEGYQVDGVRTAAEGLEYARAYSYDVLIMDLQLPDGTGTELLRRLREEGHSTPALVLTARGDLGSKVENLQAGADDYVVKPVAIAELGLRVQALLRRAPKIEASPLVIADLEINRLTRGVTRSGKRIELSPKEYDLLDYLATNAGRAVSRNMIVGKVWDQSFEGLTRMVDVYISHLRHKLDEGREKKLIRTVRGLGYMLDPNP